jgi:hypothetical protein
MRDDAPQAQGSDVISFQLYRQFVDILGSILIYVGR